MQAGGDPSQLVIGYLDATGAWAAANTSVDASGRLAARIPATGMLAILRQAPTFWATPNVDLQLAAADGTAAGTASAGTPIEIVAAQGTTFQVRLGDGRIATLDGTQTTNVPAPDALPPLPQMAAPQAPDTQVAGVQQDAGDEATASLDT